MQTKPSEKPGGAVTFSVRLWQGQRDLLLAAATAKRMTLPDWIISTLVPIAAKDAGVTLPKFPEFKRRPFHGRAFVEKAAEKLGMTAKDFQEHVLREAVERVLSGMQDVPQPPAKPKKRR